MVKHIKDMNREERKSVLVDIITDIDEGADFGDIKDDEPLRDQLDLDSMDFLDIVMELRKKYQMQIPEKDYMELNTMNSSITYFEKFKY